jgi:hypothetical protein
VGVHCFHYKASYPFPDAAFCPKPKGQNYVKKSQHNAFLYATPTQLSGYYFRMVSPLRIESLLSQIEMQAFRLSRVEAHPAFSVFVKQEPDLTEALGAVRKFWNIFQQDVQNKDPLIENYIDQLEHSTVVLSRDLDKLYGVLGFSDAVIEARVLN